MYVEKKQDGGRIDEEGRNMDEVVEVSTDLLRRDNSSNVLYSRIHVCMASCSLFQEPHVLGNHCWRCAVVFRDDVYASRSKRTRI